MAMIGMTFGSSTGMADSTWKLRSPHQCLCCGRNLGLPSGDRGLCDGCEEDIPNHIPEEQYLTYMKELWRKK